MCVFDMYKYFRKYSYITKAVKNLQLNPNLESSFTVKKIYGILACKKKNL